MDIKFSKNTDESRPAGDNKGRQNALLVVLLLLVGGVAYIYFFTGLIKPMPEQKVAEVPAAQVVKNPLPAPDGVPAKPAAVTDGVKKETAPPVAAGTPAQPAVPVAPVVTPAAKPAPPATAKPKEESKVVAEAQPAVKKVSPGAAAKKPAPVEKKSPVVAEAKPQAAKEAEKKAAAVKKPAEKQVAVADVKTPKASRKALKKEAAASGKWTVQIGNYVLEETMATDLARIRKAGLEAYVLPGKLKKNRMNRLLLAEFTDRETAQAELAKLKRQTADAFMIDAGGMHVVYAGSYLLDSRAASEKARLAAAGFKLTIKRAEVAIPSKNLTAGSFAEKSAAEAVLKKLRAAKVKATLIQQ